MAAAAVGVVGAVTDTTSTPTSDSNYMVMQGDISYTTSGTCQHFSRKNNPSHAPSTSSNGTCNGPARASLWRSVATRVDSPALTPSFPLPPTPRVIVDPSGLRIYVKTVE